MAEDAGQFVPFAKQTELPPREMLPPVMETLAEVRLPMVALFAYNAVPLAVPYERAVVVAFVVVVFEKIPVEADVMPIDVPLIVPPPIEALFVVNPPMVAELAYRAVPLAVPYERAVVVALVVVVFEKIPVEADVRPIGVPLIDPPPIEALFEVKLANVPEFPFTVVAVTVPKYPMPSTPRLLWKKASLPPKPKFVLRPPPYVVVPTRKLVFVPPPTLKVLVPFGSESKITPAVAVVLPPKSTSMVLVVS